jgi:hypothetical protein
VMFFRSIRHNAQARNCDDAILEKNGSRINRITTKRHARQPRGTASKHLETHLASRAEAALVFAARPSYYNSLQQSLTAILDRNHLK